MDTNILRKDRPEGNAPTDETPHACWDGWVYMGFEGEDENGEHVEVIERVPCRRCAEGIYASVFSSMAARRSTARRPGDTSSGGSAGEAPVFYAVARERGPPGLFQTDRNDYRQEG